MTRLWFVRVFTVTVMGAISAASGFAQGTGPKAHVELRLLSTQRSGATGSSASCGSDLAIGEKWVGGVYGDFDASHGAGGWIARGERGYAWRLEARLVSVGLNSVRVAITWGRYRRDTGGETPDVGGSRTVTLATAQRHVLDVVQSEDPSSDEANFVVEFEANLAEDPAYRHAVIDYDVWFVHDSAAGTKATRRVQVSGSHGEWETFSLRPFGFALDGRVLAGASPAPVQAYANGEIIGRLRPDGTIALAIRNVFGTDCSVSGSTRGLEGGVTGGRGEKELIARDGETISIELPTRMGWCTVIPPPPLPANARPGLKAVNGGLRVTAEEFYGGDRFSLLVTAKARR